MSCLRAKAPPHNEQSKATEQAKISAGRCLVFGMCYAETIKSFVFQPFLSILGTTILNVSQNTLDVNCSLNQIAGFFLSGKVAQLAATSRRKKSRREKGHDSGGNYANRSKT